ncbi:YezD family protein [Bacillus sp. JJ1566]|uniref:YezD family protein n=1 Tax=Bacillus sp. JJ1566 TaxID=3122961 RepID=UPI002FFFD9BC
MAKLDESKVKYILSALENLDYGSIVITVHGGEITQIDATEKKRFSLQKSTSTQNLSKTTK